MRLLSLTSILLLTLAIIPVALPGVTKHGCAPLVPPAVSGTLVQPPATHGTLFINEVLLRPRSTWNCSELQEHTYVNDAWIEIYNAQNQPYDLYAAHTTIDSGPGTNPFYLPFGSAIAPHGFLVVFPRLSAPYFQETETQTLRLLIGSTPIDEVDAIPAMSEDYSYARVPDGSSNWEIISVPTIDTSNSPAVIPPTVHRTKAEATATARVLARQHRGSKSTSDRTGSDGSSTGSGDNGTDTGKGQQQVDGVQPSWGSLVHPGQITPTPPTDTQTGNTGVTPRSDDPGVPRKILLTVLLVALAGVLCWCWRLFRPT